MSAKSMLMSVSGGLQGTVRGGGYEFVKYFLVSLLALAFDLAVLLILSKFIHYGFAAAVGFMAGAVVHYFLSVLFVFRHRKLNARKLVESVLFVGTGAAGLLVNVGVIALCVELLSASLPLAKIVAAGFSFLFGYVSRKLLLF